MPHNINPIIKRQEIIENGGLGGQVGVGHMVVGVGEIVGDVITVGVGVGATVGVGGVVGRKINET
jgi:hypothetical protein